jgi:hypothetical protein
MLPRYLVDKHMLMGIYNTYDHKQLFLMYFFVEEYMSSIYFSPTHAELSKGLHEKCREFATNIREGRIKYPASLLRVSTNSLGQINLRLRCMYESCEYENDNLVIIPWKMHDQSSFHEDRICGIALYKELDVPGVQVKASEQYALDYSCKVCKPFWWFHFPSTKSQSISPSFHGVCYNHSQDTSYKDTVAKCYLNLEDATIDMTDQKQAANHYESAVLWLNHILSQSSSIGN